MNPRPQAEHEALVALFVADLRGRADAIDDPHGIVGLALHASAALTAELGPFERDGVSCSRGRR